MPDYRTDHVRPSQAQPALRGWDGFVARYGWRAYALPVLVVVTVAAVIAQVRPSHTAGATTAKAASGTTQTSPAHAQRIEGLTRNSVGFKPAATKKAKPIVVDLGSDSTSCANNSYSQLLLVSIKKQHLWACQGSKQVNSFPVTTGADGDDMHTPLGSWRVQAKQRDRYLVGAGYRDYVKYWVPFNGDFGLHDASWQTIPFGSAQYHQDGSHGCVHVPTPQMSWVYRWAQITNTVVTIEA